MPRIVGRYELHRELASGGMGAVYLGRIHGEAGFSRAVAIKKIHDHLAKEPGVVDMFLDEARLSARIRHPNVVPTLDVVSADGDLLVVMEYVHGDSLARLTQRCRKTNEAVPLPIVVAIVADALEGLHAAHEATNERGVPLQIVHRDVSPHNLLVGVDGQTRVLDFGIAKAIERSASTGDAELKGKLGYMAPERIRRQPSDARVDVWAAAVVLWELVAMDRLFPSEAAPAIEAILHQELEMPGDRNPQRGALDPVLRRALARDPNERFESAREMCVALEALVPRAPAREVGRFVRRVAKEALAERQRMLEEMEVAPTFVTAPPSAPPPHSVTPPPTPSAPPREAPSRRGRIATAVVLGALLVGTVAYASRSLGRASATDPPITPASTTATNAAPPPATSTANPTEPSASIAPIVASGSGSPSPTVHSVHTLRPPVVAPPPPSADLHDASAAAASATADPLERNRRQ